jgi:hypothetical protein
MTLEEFKSYVESRAEWFRGRFPESDESLKNIEEALGMSLPGSLKWLLKEYGYWHATSVSSLEESVRATSEARTYHSLPKQYIVLNDYQDCGLILIDTGESTSPGEYPLYWPAWEDIIPAPNLSGASRYDTFPDYVADMFESNVNRVDEKYVRYDPKDFPEGNPAASQLRLEWTRSEQTSQARLAWRWRLVRAIQFGREALTVSMS